MLRSFFFGSERDGKGQIRCCNSFLEWILYGLGDQRNLHKVLETGFEDDSVDDGLFELKLYRGDEQRELSGYIESLRFGREEKPERKPDSEQGRVLEELKENISWRYEYEAVSALPAKRTVTQLTHGGDEFVRFEHSKALERKPKASLSSDSAGRADSRVIGTAVHLLISGLDLTAPVTKQSVEETKERLLRTDAISRAVAESIDTESIVKFFEGRPGRLAAEKANEVWREWPFTFALPASELKNSCVFRNTRYAIRDTIVVQGIIDMLIITAGGVVIVDFKTDRIGAGKARERAELYRSQLELYGRAASAILNQKLLSKWLYFLNCAVAVEIR
ncbi:ATP-dependent helicase/nuclease subunit A [subsurface metagenome]